MPANPPLEIPGPPNPKAARVIHVHVSSILARAARGELKFDKISSAAAPPNHASQPFPFQISLSPGQQKPRHCTWPFGTSILERKKKRSTRAHIMCAGRGQDEPENSNPCIRPPEPAPEQDQVRGASKQSSIPAGIPSFLLLSRAATWRTPPGAPRGRTRRMLGAALAKIVVRLAARYSQLSAAAAYPFRRRPGHDRVDRSSPRLPKGREREKHIAKYHYFPFETPDLNGGVAGCRIRISSIPPPRP
ncbi:hypothetical protein F4781DRAFT_427834 [Annulohypoxylon bovei var. microspora]|nr:hypothetical protein F4781DRAFT_427834 [Annulohypoxylon bovei var. microspora]